MTSIPDKYPEIPARFLSAVVAWVGYGMLTNIIETYDESNKGEWLPLADLEKLTIAPKPSKKKLAVLHKPCTPDNKVLFKCKMDEEG